MELDVNSFQIPFGYLVLEFSYVAGQRLERIRANYGPAFGGSTA